jgi:hypothetical protein
MHTHLLIDVIIPAYHEVDSNGKVDGDIPYAIKRNKFVCTPPPVDHTALNARASRALVPNQQQLCDGTAFLDILVKRFRFTDIGLFRALRWQNMFLPGIVDKYIPWIVEVPGMAFQSHLSNREMPISHRKHIGKSKVRGILTCSAPPGYNILWTMLKSL